MADELAVVECDKCGAKLKVRAVALKILKDIKCGKCGAKVPIKKSAPVPTDSTPIPISSSPVPPNPPAPPGMVTEKVSPKETPPAKPAPDDAALSEARARIGELEKRVADLEARLMQATAPNDDLARAQREIHEQSERVSELQQLWMQKEKESREAFQQAERAKKERLEALADRERTIAALKEVLTNYHIAEIESAKARMAELDHQIQNFLSMSRTRDPAG